MEGEPERPPALVRSTYDAVDRGLVTLALVWQFLWIVGDSRLWPQNAGSSVPAALLIACAAAWIGLLVAHAVEARRWRRILQVVNVALLEGAALALLIIDAQHVPHDWSAASSIAILPGAMAGLMFSTQWAGTWIAATIMAETAIIVGLGGNQGESAVAQDILYPAYALAISIACLAARRALLRDALSVDEAAADLDAVERERRVVEGVEASVRREERLLHATVLNTLTAIVRGGVATPELRERLRERCCEAVQVMAQVRLHSEPSRATRSPERNLEVDLRESIVDLFTAGVVVHAKCQSLRDVPVDVYDAIVTASREALANVLRHADAHAVWLTAEVSGGRGPTQVSVQVRDDGRGFESATSRQGFGLRAAVVQALTEVGGTSTVRSEPGDGTTVDIRCSTEHRAPERTLYRPAARAFSYPILLAVGVFTALAIVLTREEMIHPIWSLSAFAMFCALTVLTLFWSNRGTVPWWVVLVVIGVSPLIYQLQTHSVVTEHGPWADWSSAAIVSLFVVVAAAGPTWSWPALLATWLLIQGDVLHELLAPGTALIIAAALFGRSTRSGAAAIERARLQQVEEQAAVDVSSESVRRLASRYGSLRESRVSTLLDGIASGRIDPDDDATRFQAALEERFIRTVVKVDPAADAVHALATSLAVRALHCGVFLDVEISDGAPRGLGPSAAARESLARAIDCAEPGGSARLSARPEGPDYTIRLITPISGQFREEMNRLAVPGALVGPSEPEMLWELRI